MNPLNLTLNEAWCLFVAGLWGWICIRELKIYWLKQQLFSEREEKRIAQIEQINKVLTEAELDLKLDHSFGRESKD